MNHSIREKMGEDWFRMIKEVGGKQFLLVGEGNFSFAAAFLEELCSATLKPRRFVATAFGEEAVECGDDAAKDCTARILENGGEVFWNIDATSLPDYAELLTPPFDYIIFNFPHVGGKMRIDKNRALLAGFLQSASVFLPDMGKEDRRRPQVWLSLCGGQGGTGFDQPKRHWNDSWQLPLIAARSGFMLTKVVSFPSHLVTYRQTGYRGLRKPFLLGAALTHVLERLPESRLQKLPPWMRNILAKSCKPLGDGEFLDSCSPCDPEAFTRCLVDHEVTQELKHELENFGEVRVVSCDVLEEEMAVNHPPCSVFIEVAVGGETVNDFPEIVSSVAQNCVLIERIKDSIAQSDLSDQRLRVDLLRLFRQSSLVSSWSDAFALCSSHNRLVHVDLGALTFVHHLSVWKDDAFNQTFFCKVIFERFSLIVKTIKHLEDWTSEDGKSSSLYEFTYNCRIVPFSDEACKKFHCWLLPRFLKLALNVIVR